MPSAAPTLIAITPNPAVDVTITVDTLVDEATHRIDTAQRRLGGKGVNVATVAAAQGYPTSMLGPVSASSLEGLSERGLSFPELAHPNFSPTPVPLRETWAIHRTADNGTVIINESGASHPPAVWDDLADRIVALGKSGARVMTISGSWPKGTSSAILTRLINAATGAGVEHIIVDCAGENLITACRAGAIVKPNAAEIAETTGHTDPVDGARELLTYGSPLVVVSMGADGLLAATGTEMVTAKLPTPLEGNPTGAGDSLVAALATGLSDGLSLTELIVRGVAWSAAAVLVPYAGAIDPSWPELSTQVMTGRL